MLTGTVLLADKHNPGTEETLVIPVNKRERVNHYQGV